MRKSGHSARRKLELLTAGSLQRSSIKLQRDLLIEQIQPSTWVKRIASRSAAAAAWGLFDFSGANRILSLAMALWPVRRRLCKHLKPWLTKGIPLLGAGIGGYLFWRWARSRTSESAAAPSEQTK